MRLEIRPSRFEWAHGDGTTATTATPGAPYPAKDVVHRYADAHTTVQHHVSVTWSAEWSLNGGPLQPVNGTVTTTGPATPLRSRRRARRCRARVTENPSAGGLCTRFAACPPSPLDPAEARLRPDSPRSTPGSRAIGAGWAHRARFVTKPLLMPTLAASLVTNAKAEDSPLRASTLVAQAGGWGGDVALLGEGTIPFLAGTGSFAVGHAAYLPASSQPRATAPFDALPVRAVAGSWAG